MTHRSHSTKRALWLINPKAEFKHYAAQDDLAWLMRKKTTITPLALPIIAALTPDRYDVRIIDEEIEPLPRKGVPDLAGITTTNATIGRAFRVADGMRQSGAKVVLGGPSASFLVERALEHADSVVIGEVEGVWDALLADFEAGALKPTYRADKVTEFKTSPFPRWDLVDTRKVVSINVEVSRGCPYACEFCCVTQMFGRRQRYRDVEDVLAEVRRLPSRRIMFVDDNLTANKAYCRELFEKIAPLGLTWLCQSSIEIAEHDDLLGLMAEAGCMSIIIGFESLNPASLDEAKKHQNRIQRYAEVVRRIHSFGIGVTASFIVGFDSDTDEDFERIAAFVLDNKLPNSMISILGAPPGTELAKRMEREDRILRTRPELNCGIFPSLRYRNFGTAEILDRYFETSRRLKSSENIDAMARGLFEGGAFTRMRAADVGFATKLGTSLTILGKYLFTKDAIKRRMLRDLFALSRSGRLGMNELVVFLLTMAGYEGFFARAEEFLPRVREELRAAAGE